jgi:hypothetical protein
MGIPPIVNDTLRSPGRQLDPATRGYMESRFGFDLSGVRIHADSASAPAISALAYTVGQDIVFAPQRYAPTQADGRRLLAHELAHVVQQSRGVSGSGADPDPALEYDAERAADAVAGGAPAPVSGSSGVTVARQPSGGGLLPALSPNDLLKFLHEQRGFGSSTPGPPAVDPKGIGSPAGKGYETYAAVQILTKDGSQVRVGIGAYLGGGDAHGEAQAVAALRSGLPKGVDVTGGSMMVAVEKEPCPNCANAIKDLARDLGLSEYTVYVPDRASMTNPAMSVTAKQASRTVFQGGRPPTTPRAVTTEKLPPKPGGGAGGGEHAGPGGRGAGGAVGDTPHLAGGGARPAAAAPAGAASAVSEEARTAARAAAASVATDFKILRVAKVINTALNIIQFISALQTLDEFINMTNNSLAGKGFILTKEIAESSDIADKAKAFDADYKTFSASITNSQINLLKALGDATAAGRAVSSISEVQEQLHSIGADLPAQIARVERAEREASSKQKAAENILNDPQASGAIAAVTFGTAQLAEIFAASQDLQRISGSLRSASASLRSAQSAISDDDAFLAAWSDSLFQTCVAGGACSRKDIQIPFVGTSHVRVLPGAP